MDDMKKLVEKYKRELMEYSRAAKHDPPGRLEFPEMTAEDKVLEITEDAAEYAAPAEVADAIADTDTISDSEEKSSYPISEEKPDVKRAPEMIGYTDSGDLMSVFSGMFVTEDSPVVEMQADEVQQVPSNAAEPDSSDDMEHDGVSTVTPEAAEQLGDIPESGTSPDEQLGKRDFEEQSDTENPRSDIQPLVQSGEAAADITPQTYNSLREFTEANPRRGTVRFRTYTARGALPVAGARIVVSKPIGGSDHIFYTMTTDMSGQTPMIMLPAPPKELSETPNGTIAPYSVYNVRVSADGYNDVVIGDLPVFEGVTSVQRVALVPSVGQNVPELIPESEPDLKGGV